MNKKTNLFSNIVFNYIYQILLIIIPLITAPYISRVLGPDGIGIYSYTHSLITYFTLFAGLGTASYGLREISRKRDNKEEYTKTFWEIEIMTIISSLIMSIFWVIFAACYSQYRIYMLLQTFLLIQTMFDISWFFQGLEKFKYTTIVNSIVKIAGVILIFTFVKTKEDLNLYILIQSLTLAISSISMWLFLPRFILKVKISLRNLKHHFKETLVYFIPTIAVSIYTVLDKTLIGLITKNDAENGYYEQATKIINLLKAISFSSIVGVMTSRVSYLYKDNKIEEIKKNLLFTLEIVMFLAFACGFGIAAIASRFVPIFFGEGYDQTIILLYIMTVLLIIIAISNVLGGLYYTPSGKRKQSALFIIVGSIVNLILNIPLIYFFKSYGAAIASIIAELVITILYLKNCTLLTFAKLFKIIYKKLIAGLVMFLLVFTFDYFLNFNTYLMLICEILIGAIIYITTLLLLKDQSIKLTVNFIKEKIKRN